MNWIKIDIDEPKTYPPVMINVLLRGGGGYVAEYLSDKISNDVIRRILLEESASDYCIIEPPGESECEWKEEHSFLKTGCGHRILIGFTMPPNSNIKFCCFCGKKLIEVPYDAELKQKINKEI